MVAVAAEVLVVEPGVLADQSLRVDFGSFDSYLPAALTRPELGEGSASFPDICRYSLPENLSMPAKMCIRYSTYRIWIVKELFFFEFDGNVEHIVGC